MNLRGDDSALAQLGFGHKRVFLCAATDPGSLVVTEVMK